MSSDRYEFKSNNLWQQYQDKLIDNETYMNSLEQIIREETSSFGFYSQPEQRERLWSYERNRQKRSEYEKQKREKGQEELEAKRKEAERLENLTRQEKYYEIEIPKVIEEYRTESKRYRKVHNRFQWIVMIGSVIVTSTTGATVLAESSQLSFMFKWISVVFSILVSISAAATGYFKFRERSANLQETADDIEHEYKAVGLEIDRYMGKSKKEALTLFAQVAEVRIKEQKKREQQLEQPPDTNSVQAPVQIRSGS